MASTQPTFVRWRSNRHWLGVLVEHPQYMTQARTLSQLRKNVRDLLDELNPGFATYTEEPEILGRDVLLETDGTTGLIVASVPDMRGAHTQGATREEALANLVEVLEMLAHERRQPDSSH